MKILENILKFSKNIKRLIWKVWVSWRLTHKLAYALCSRDRCSGSDWEAEKCDTGPQTSQKKLKFIQKNTNSALQKKHICELQWKWLLYIRKWKAIRDCMAVILWSTLPKKGKKWNLKRLDESSTAAGSILNHPVAPSIPSGVITFTSESGLSWEQHQCLLSPNTTLHTQKIHFSNITETIYKFA